MSEVLGPRPGTIVVSFHVGIEQALATVADAATRICSPVDRRAAPESVEPMWTAPVARIR